MSIAKQGWGKFGGSSSGFVFKGGAGSLDERIERGYSGNDGMVAKKLRERA